MRAKRVTPKATPTRDVILAAVDDSPAAVGVARWAGDLARASGGEVVVCSVVPIPPALRGMAGIGWIDEKELFEDEAAATIARVRPVLDELGVRYRIEVDACLARRWHWSQARQVAAALLRAARAADANVIVMGHRPERASERSSVAEPILRASPTDVLVVPVPAVTESTGEHRRVASRSRRAS